MAPVARLSYPDVHPWLPPACTLAREVILSHRPGAGGSPWHDSGVFFGYDLDSAMAYGTSLVTLAGAAILAGTRMRERHVSQEAVIGVVYAVSAAAAILRAVDRAPTVSSTSRRCSSAACSR